MQKKLEIEVKVGFFITSGVLLILLAILTLGGANSYFTRRVHFTAHFDHVNELIPGAKVVLNGIRVGAVEAIEFDRSQNNIKLMLSVRKDFAYRIRQSAMLEITTQGVLGDKFIAITGGAPEDPELPPGSEIQAKTPQDMAKFLTNGEQLITSANHIASSIQRILDSFEKDQRSDIFFKGMSLTAKNLGLVTQKIDQEMEHIPLKQSVQHLESILRKINEGKGTLGAFVNDPSIYDDAKSLIGGINRNRVMRNLLRQTVKEGEAGER